MINLVKRAEWQARKPKSRSTVALTEPSTGHWNGPKVTVRGQPTWEHSVCPSLVRGIQNFHMDGRGWSDIAYNFLICPHGYVFEGRGLDVVNAANGTNIGNRTSHAIMWLAGKENPFIDSEKSGFRECVRYVADSTKAPDECVGHRDHKATECPGDERYNWIRQGMLLPGAVTPPSPPPPEDEFPVLRLESRGEAVKRVQTIIRDKAGGDIAVDGIFGPNTHKRVMDVQRLFGLQPDGVVGPKTWDVLNYLASVNPKPFGDWPSQSKSVLKVGSMGGEVMYLQRVIEQKAGGNIAVDGNFGPNTKRRVQDIQRLFGLKEDGVVGVNTWKVIDFLASS